MTTTQLTVENLRDALYREEIITPVTLISLLGDRRHQLNVNALEVALVRKNILSEDRLLDIKAAITGRPIIRRSDPLTATNHLPEELVKRHGALLMNNHASAVVAMVEDTPANVEAVTIALDNAPFTIALIAAPHFGDLYRAAYNGAAIVDAQHAETIYDVIDAAIAARSSDLHISVGMPPKIRVDGGLTSLPFKPIDRTWIREQIEQLAEERHIKELDATFSTDLAYSYGLHRFRINVGHDANGPTLAMRKLPSKIPTADDIDLPESIRKFAHLERGMVVVTGPTGSGKTTTLAAILNDIIMGSSRHVITLEDPIEFKLPTDGPSHVNQRELGSSFPSFADGIRDAMRQDPDVILVGELRDRETIDAALKAAETGHLCIATLHTYDAASTIMRLVNSFPSAEQPAVRAQLSQLLRGVVSQTLVPRASTKGRVAAFEILVNNTAISANLRKEDGHNQLKQAMQTSAKEGMQTMEKSLAYLAQKGVISKEEARFRARDEGDFDKELAYYAAHGTHQM